MTTESTQSIVVDYDLAQPPHKVWRALTDPALLASWLMPNDIAPVVGHRFTFQSKPMPGWDGKVECEVLEVKPEALIRYSWRGGSEQFRLDTEVRWTLTPQAGGTRLTLVHSGFTAKDAFALDGLGKGWRGNVGERLLAAIGAME